MKNEEVCPVDLHDIEYFVTLIEERSFSKAAAKLIIAQPEQEVTAGQKLEIAYTVQNGNESTVVDCFAGGNYTAKIADGKVIVTVPDPVADGQVLVIHDMLGMNNGFSPKFLRRYADLHTVMTDAIGQYVTDVKSGDFPNETEKY